MFHHKLFIVLLSSLTVLTMQGSEVPMDLFKKISYSKDLHVTLATKLATFGLNKYAQKKSISPAKKKFVRRLNKAAPILKLFFKESKNYSESCQECTKIICIDLSVEYTLDMIPINLPNFVKKVIKFSGEKALTYLTNKQS